MKKLLISSLLSLTLSTWVKGKTHTIPEATQESILQIIVNNLSILLKQEVLQITQEHYCQKLKPEAKIVYFYDSKSLNFCWWAISENTDIIPAEISHCRAQTKEQVYCDILIPRHPEIRLCVKKIQNKVIKNNTTAQVIWKLLILDGNNCNNLHR